MAAMKETLNFKKEIMMAEWNHRKLKMHIEDYKEHLKDMETIQMTKEVQRFLKARRTGDTRERGLTFEQEVDLIQESYQSIIDERKGKVKEMQVQINKFKREIKKLGREIEYLNVDVCEYKIDIDPALPEKERKIIHDRMKILINRSALVKRIQENHNELMLTQTQLELLRLKTYPTLRFKIFY